MSSERQSQLIVYLDSAELGPRRPVGVLRLTGSGRGVVAFTYARSWLTAADAFPIDPMLPLIEPDQYVGGGLPGVISDTAPDRWGRTLLDRREVMLAAAQGRRSRVLRDWDYMIGVSDVGRLGALRLAAEPGAERFLDDSERSVPPLTRLRALEHAASVVETSGTAADEEIALLLAPGSSLGGARPKATYAAADNTLWIAKFPSRGDTRDVGAWEYVLVELAERAGIDVPEHQLLTLGSEARTYAARRFDRSGTDRRLVASAMTLTSRHDGQDASYLEVALAIADHGAPSTIALDLEQLFRRVVFSVLVANRDDHLRNHAFIRTRAGWRLAPAYDLNPAPEKVDHSLALDERNTEPRVDLVRSTAEWYRLRLPRADEIIEEVTAAVSSLPVIAREISLPSHEIEIVASALPAAS